MSNIFSIVTIEEKNWRSQNNDFLGLKNLSPGNFGELPLTKISVNFKTFYCNLKIRDLGTKLIVAFLLFSFWKELWRLKVKDSCILFNKNITERNQKSKIPHIVLERRTLCFNSFKNRKLEIKLRWVGARERKKRVFFYRLFLSKEFF